MAACDSRDYEAEIATLEGENQQLQTEVEELRTQAEAQPALEEGALENVQAQLNSVVQTAAQTFQRVGSSPEAGAAGEGAETLQADLQLIVQSAQTAAQDLGLELETVTMDTDAGPSEGTPEPAAGPETQQQEPAAQGEQPAPAGEQPATEGEEQPAPAQ